MRFRVKLERSLEGRLVAVLALAILVAFWIVPGAVFAHANYARSEPEANAVVAEPPERVVIWFTEPLAEEFSSIEVLNSQGARVDNDDNALDPEDPFSMSVSLQPLPNGTYTVAWRSLSTVDGHTSRGAFVFSVGEPITAGAEASAQSGPTLLQSPAEPVFRWLVLTSALVIVGGIAFELIVLGPAIARSGQMQNRRRLPHNLEQLRNRLHLRTQRLCLVALVVLVVASLGHLFVQTGNIYQISVFRTFGAPAVSVLTDTAWGRQWLLRLVLVFGIAGILRLPRYGSAIAAIPRLSILRLSRYARLRNAATNARIQSAQLPIALLLGLIVLFTFSMSSHANATPGLSGPALFNDYLHLMAVCLWVGGLFQMALVLPLVLSSLPSDDRRSLLNVLIPRFSVVAGLSVAVLTVTGLYSAWAQVTVFPAMLAPYGIALAVKIGVVAPLLLLGAANLIWVRPRLRGDSSGTRWLRRFVAAEAVVAVLVLLATGVLTSLEPARQVASRADAEQGVHEFQDTVEGAQISLSVEPGRVGPNDFTLALTDRFGDAITNATDARLRVSYLDADLGEEPVSMVSTGGGTYELDDTFLSLAGAWQAEITVLRPDAFDARTAFRFETVTGGSGGSGSITPDPDTGRLLLGAELAFLGLVFMGAGIPMGGWYNRRGLSVMAPGIVGLIAGAVLILNTNAVSGGGQAVRNPIAPTSDSISAGQTLYTDTCQTCHGETGLGDGPTAADLQPPPANLGVHVPLHPDYVLFEFIRDGIAGTPMTGVGNTMTDDEIWHVINYIKTFAE